MHYYGILSKKMRDSGFISIKEKILIVCQVIAAGKIQPIARKHGISRPSVYAWSQKALNTLPASTKTRETGPKCKKGKVDVKDKVIEK